MRKMFLTKITIPELELLSNSRHLADNYQWHRLIWKCFEGFTERPFVFTVDHTNNNFIILILSSHIPKSLSLGKWKTKAISKEFYQSDKYLFKIKLNATKKSLNNTDKEAKGKRHSVINPIKWLDDRSENLGFEIISAKLNKKGKSYSKRGKHIHGWSEITGVLKVVNRKSFVQSATLGIGRAKAYGYGMLLLKKHK